LLLLPLLPLPLDPNDLTRASVGRLPRRSVSGGGGGGKALWETGHYSHPANTGARSAVFAPDLEIQWICGSNVSTDGHLTSAAVTPDE
jgi:hypothetical protein